MTVVATKKAAAGTVKGTKFIGVTKNRQGGYAGRPTLSGLTLWKDFKTEKQAASYYNEMVANYLRYVGRSKPEEAIPARRLNILKGKRVSKPVSSYKELKKLYQNATIFGLKKW